MFIQKLILGLHSESNQKKMNQKPTYKIFNFFPEYSLEKWDDVYKSWVETYILTPKEQRNGSMWTGFVENVNTLKSFLKSHGRKFI